MARSEIPRAPQVHVFSSSGEAYDASQTWDDINDGDVLSVPSEKVVGFLVEAWPVAISENLGSFHSLAENVDPKAVPNTDGTTKDYSASFDLATETLKKLHIDAVEAERDALREALKSMTPDSPWDVDQDCRYCAGHYDWHEDNCSWLLARAALGEIED